MKKVFTILIMLALSSCLGTDELSDEPLFKTNFDDLAGWVPEQSLIYGRARSGNYSIGVDANNEYSLMWKRTVSKLSSKNFSKIRLAAYAKLTGEKNEACIVVSIDRGKENIYWTSMEFKKFKLDKESWTRIETFLEIPPVGDKDAQVNIYLWGKNGSAALVDDMEIEFSI